METMSVKVRSIREDAIGIRVFELAAADSHALPAAAPGDHIDVHITEDLVRQYSICNPGCDTHYVIGIKRVEPSRGGSEAMHQVVREGDVLRIGRPRSNFRLNDDGRPKLLIAGGIGITPILSMATALAARNAPFRLHYFAQSPEHAAFRRQLARSELAPHARLRLRLAGGALERAVSLLTESRQADEEIYLCGPAPFMALVQQSALDHGWPAAAIRTEYFAAAPAAPAASAPFTLRLQRSGLSTEVASHETILAALRRLGLPVRTSCEQGICGTCEARVLSGTPEHRDSYLSEEESRSGRKICVCVSRSKGRELVLDL
ncbi:oxidoreductase [Xanthobacter dioxanivorans]|uniref:Oxidoreductase n=1 Tax=Xanthobacter dioxanivorans TaxID=2528964 RepID=A0A974SK32_9HYPH|nr:PDR/VanB family oxidoreductase [Xanthobacter dioxanivorans]QRG08395.1 oxidoreductase [Xanthobacter dioxanivorans]